MIRVGVFRGGLGRSGYHLGTSQLPSRFALNSRSNCKIVDLRLRGKGDCGLLGYDNINSLYSLKMEAVYFIETLTTAYQTICHNTEIHIILIPVPCILNYLQIDQRLQIISNTIITNNMLLHVSTFRMSSSGNSLRLAKITYRFSGLDKIKLLKYKMINFNKMLIVRRNKRVCAVAVYTYKRC